YLVLYNSKRPHKSLELMTPVDYILRESKNCNMWWTHTSSCFSTVCWFNRAIKFTLFETGIENAKAD
ncbi:hypothetical protein ACO0TW_13110, partial [Klebsiella pneumoniae]